MSMKKKLIIAASVATIGIGSLGVGIANAQTSTSGTGIVDKLATKFGLKKAEVQAVFDQEHTEREAQMQQNVADKLAAGVKAGTVTQAQSDAITAKLKEFQATREANRDKMQSMTEAERKAAMEAERTAMQKWITDNNIPEEFAIFAHMGGHGGPGGMHEGRGMMGGDGMSPSDDSPTAN